jgi:hypothetical protein
MSQMNPKRYGRIYEGYQPLTADSLKDYERSEQRNNEEAACACSRETHEGANSGNGIICTGAFSPYELRRRKVDPCAGDWEKK